jgi:hypothetical protein
VSGTQQSTIFSKKMKRNEKSNVRLPIQCHGTIRGLIHHLSAEVAHPEEPILAVGRMSGICRSGDLAI